MVDWTSPEALARQYLAFNNFMHALIGLYAWEWFISLDFEWQFITRRKRFHWPMIFYFLNRYCMLTALIGVIIGLNVRKQINCQVLYNITVTIGACAIGFASINLSLRTMAVWNRRWYIVAPLTVLILSHFGLLLHVVTLRIAWMPEKGCVITFTDDTVLGATFIYAMVFDFTILSLTAVKLFQTSTSSPSRLRNLIFKDGLIYFIVAVLTNVLTTSLILLDLSPIMSVISNVPGTILQTIVACRVVRRLNDYSSSGPETFATTAQPASIAFNVTRVYPTLIPGEGIHLQMDTFQSSSSDSPDTSQVATKENFDLGSP